jgi:hypothetical protein
MRSAERWLSIGNRSQLSAPSRLKWLMKLMIDWHLWTPVHGTADAYSCKTSAGSCALWTSIFCVWNKVKDDSSIQNCKFRSDCESHTFITGRRTLQLAPMSGTRQCGRCRRHGRGRAPKRRKRRRGTDQYCEQCTDPEKNKHRPCDRWIWWGA